jgi:hypothetical protein
MPDFAGAETYLQTCAKHIPDTVPGLAVGINLSLNPIYSNS